MVTPYDTIPYPGSAHAESHPDHLGALGSLLGLEPCPPSSARVLEIGCAMGHNLLPMADQLPGASFVGIDLGAVQIAEGMRLAQGLPNVQLRCADILERDPELGEFDYIICHGVYSWVPPQVQAAILRTCREHLAPQGVAFVSYNCMPGWGERMPIRDLMRFHAAGFEDPHEQVQQARAALAFVHSALEGQEGHYADLIRELHESLNKHGDHYIFHEYLSPYNEALYLDQFAERAQNAGLQILTDADFPSSCVERWPDPVPSRLRALSSDMITTEQYMDFIRNRRFRRTLLCHQERSLQRNLDATRLRGKRLRMKVTAEELSPQRDESPARFWVGETPLDTQDPVTKAAMVALAQAWPQFTGFGELLDEARTTVHSAEPRSQDELDLGNTLLACLWRGLADMRWEAGRWATSLPRRPRLSALNRRLAEKDGSLVSLDHRDLRLVRPLNRLVLGLLDGSRDLEALQAALAEAWSQGLIHEDGAPEGEELAPWLNEQLQTLLDTLLEHRLLLP